MNTTIKGFGHPDNLIKEYKNWVVLLRPQQVTPGSCVIASKSEDTNLGSLGAEAWGEFGRVCEDMEKLLKEAFGAEKFNYLALMMKDPHVHFHFIPRYSKPVMVGGISFKDEDWPHKTELTTLRVEAATFEEIKNILRQKI